jgi:hypothetical protein
LLLVINVAQLKDNRQHVRRTATRHPRGDLGFSATHLRRLSCGSRSEAPRGETELNTAKAGIDWTFTTEKARDKMGRAYPKPRRNDSVASPNTSTAPKSTMDQKLAAVHRVTEEFVAPKPVEKKSSSATTTKRKRSSRGPRARFKAGPNLPKRPPQKRKSKHEPVKTTVRSH